MKFRRKTIAICCLPLRGCRAALLLLACSVAFSSIAWCKDDGSVELIGRKGKFQVVNPDGSVQDVKDRDLNLPTVGGQIVHSEPSTDKHDTGTTGANGSPQNPADRNAQGKTIATDKKTGAKTDKGKPDPKTFAVKKPDAPKQPSPEELAARAVDVESVRKLLIQGGTYFYDANNKPLSYDQIGKMIEKGDVKGVHSVDLHLSNWESHEAAAKDGVTVDQPQFPQITEKGKGGERRD